MSVDLFYKLSTTALGSTGGRLIDFAILSSILAVNMAQLKSSLERQGQDHKPGSWRYLTRNRVYVQVSAEVAKPLDDRKFDGIFTITTELGPIASPAFEVGR